MHSDKFYPWAGLAGAIAALIIISGQPRAHSSPKAEISDNTQKIQSKISERDSLIAIKPQTSSLSEIDYFMEIALGAEWGNATPRIRRWHRSQLSISVYGNPSSKDWQALQQVRQELESLTGLQLQLSTSSSASTSDIEIYFAPEAQFSRILPTYQPGNKGFFWVWWNENGIEHAKILIDSQGIDGEARAHLIREELTQSLGLMRDSWRQEDSIFYQGWTTTSQYATIDTSLIRMLYDPRMRSGMTASEARQVLLGT